MLSLIIQVAKEQWKYLNMNSAAVEMRPEVEDWWLQTTCPPTWAPQGTGNMYLIQLQAGNIDGSSSPH